MLQKRYFCTREKEWFRMMTGAIGNGVNYDDWWRFYFAGGSAVAATWFSFPFPFFSLSTSLSFMNIRGSIPRRHPTVMPRTRPYWKSEKDFEHERINHFHCRAYEVWRSSRWFRLELDGCEVGCAHSDNFHQTFDIHRTSDAKNIRDCVAEGGGRHRWNCHDETQTVLDVISGDDHCKVVEETEANEWHRVDKTHYDIGKALKSLRDH